MVSFHAGYVWGKSGRAAYRLIAVFLMGALLVTAGLFEPSGIRDWIRYRMPSAYVEEGWRLVRFTAGLFASLYGAMVHLPVTFKYRAFVAGDGVGKLRFLLPRIFTVAMILSAVYVSFCAMYVLCGRLVSVRFELGELMIERIAWGLLFVFQSAAYAALLAQASSSMLGALPVIALSVLSMETRLLEPIEEDWWRRILDRIIVVEGIGIDGLIHVDRPNIGIFVLVFVWILNIGLYCLKDGEAA